MNLALIAPRGPVRAGRLLLLLVAGVSLAGMALAAPMVPSRKPVEMAAAVPFVTSAGPVLAMPPARTIAGLDVAESVATAVPVPGKKPQLLRVSSSPSGKPAPTFKAEKNPPAAPRAFDEAERKCLAQAIYYEARADTLEGRLAVVHTVMNRVRSSLFPDTICKVVYQGGHRRSGCQFSFTCNGIMKRALEPKPWEQSMELAGQFLSGSWQHDFTGGATMFHNLRVKPRWASRLVRIGIIGAHVFYRQKRKGDDKAYAVN
jgi:hypothetical protein